MSEVPLYLSHLVARLALLIVVGAFILTRQHVACAERCTRLRLVANRATLPQKWPPSPRNVADSCELIETIAVYLSWPRWLTRGL